MSKPQVHDGVVPGPERSRRGSAVAATALAAVLLMGIGLSPVVATEPVPQADVSAAAAGLDSESASRLVAMAQELAESVTHGEISEEQAREFLRKMSRRLAA